MPESKAPLISQGTAFTAVGQSLVIHEWTGSGPDYMHVHYEDDEAWHILEGELMFRFLDKEIVATAGITVFVPAGVAHTYVDPKGTCRYLIILTPRLNEMIDMLHKSEFGQHAEIFRRFNSEII